MKLECGCDSNKCAHDPGLAITYYNDDIYIADANGVFARYTIANASDREARKLLNRINARLFNMLDERFPCGWRQRTAFIGPMGFRMIYGPQAEAWDQTKQEPYLVAELDDDMYLSMAICDKPGSYWYDDTKTRNDTLDKYADVPRRTFTRSK